MRMEKMREDFILHEIDVSRMKTYPLVDEKYPPPLAPSVQAIWGRDGKS